MLCFDLFLSSPIITLACFEFRSINLTTLALVYASWMRRARVFGHYILYHGSTCVFLFWMHRSYLEIVLGFTNLGQHHVTPPFLARKSVRRVVEWHGQ